MSVQRERRRNRPPHVDPDPLYTIRPVGGAPYSTYLSPWHYLRIALFMFGFIVATAGWCVWSLLTSDAQERRDLLVVYLGGVVAWALLGLVGVGTLRCFREWRAARAEYAAASGTPYRSVFTLSTAPDERFGRGEPLV